MMTEPKPVASLTAGLLARKGEARPASRAYVGFASVASAAAAARAQDVLRCGISRRMVRSPVAAAPSDSVWALGSSRGSCEDMLTAPPGPGFRGPAAECLPS